ncbi:MAG: NAD-dependent epimerase/dehydratase family protein [Prolixibacteraceae bacterium]|jgi:nucleoside-diphosphate-sugar epimerase|nr:NAD-dependent epimerase/dehydratase family protein [Prolixibacteraceae bacterium]
MKILFIGGTGIISSACTNLAIQKNIELYHLNRGSSSSIRPIQAGVNQITTDVRNFEQTASLLDGLEFDAVVDWISFVPEHLENNLKLFKGKAKQFILISSASAYQTPPLSMPVTEETPLDNPYWEYSRNKIDCEKFLKENASNYGMKYTVVRPSHTYDKTLLPFDEGYTVIDRMLKGKPVVVLGDGSSIWTLTHHKDFAVGLVGLLGNAKAMDETFHITSSEWISWDRIFMLVGRAFDVEPELVHIPSEVIASYLPELGAGLLGDKMHSMLFDNSKIKAVVPEFECKIPFEEGVKEVAAWYKSGKANTTIDEKLNEAFDQMIEKVLNVRK